MTFKGLFVMSGKGIGVRYLVKGNDKGNDKK